MAVNYWKRSIRWTAMSVGGFLVAVTLVLLMGYAALHSEAGRAWIVQRLEAAVSSAEGLQLRIGALEEGSLQSIRMSRVSLSDPQGLWLSAASVALDWDALALVSRTLRITDFRITDLKLARLPADLDGDEEKTSEPELPSLPFKVAVERLAFNNVALGEEVFGIPVTFRVLGQANSEEDDTLRGGLRLERTDGGVAGRAEVRASYEPASRRLVLDVDMAEASGGLIVRSLQVPDLPALAVTLKGDGPLDDWQGGLWVSLEGLTSLEAELALFGTAPVSFSLAGQAETLRSLREMPWRLLEGQQTFSIEGDWDGERRLALKQGRLEIPWLELEFGGTLDSDNERIEAQINAHLKDASVLGEMAPDATVKGVHLKASAEGHLLQPELSIEAAIERFAVPGIAASQTTAQLRVRLSRPLDRGPPRGFISASGQVEAMSVDAMPELAALVGDHFAWGLEGHIDFEHSVVEAESLIVNAGPGEAEVAGRFAYADGAAKTNMRMELSDLTGLGKLLGTSIKGRAQLAGPLEIRDFGRSVQAEFTGALDGMAFDEPTAQALFAGRTNLKASIAMRPEGRAEVRGLLVEGSAVKLSGEVGLSMHTNQIEASYRLSVPDAGVLSATLGVPLGGAVVIGGNVEGDASNPHLAGSVVLQDAEVKGYSLERLELGYGIENLLSQPHGRFDVNASTPIGLFTGGTDFNLQESRFRLTNTRIVGEGLTLNGQADLPLHDDPIVATLTVQSERLAPWLTLAGLTGDGQAQALIKLSGTSEHQSLELRTTVADVSVQIPDGEPIAIAEARVDATSADLFGRRNGTVKATVKDLTIGTLAFAELNVEGEGGGAGATVNLSAKGEWLGELIVTARAGISAEPDGVRVDLEQLEGSALSQTIRLNQPVQFAHSAGGLQTSELRLDFGSAHLTGQLTYEPKSVNATLAVAELPLAYLEPLWPQAQNMAGQVSGKLQLDGPTKSPAATLQLAGSKLRFEKGPDAPALDLSLASDWRNSRLSVEGSVTGFSERGASVTASLPLRHQPEASVPVFPRDEPLSGRITWEGELARIGEVIPVVGHRVQGNGELNVELAGTLEQPRLSGHLRVAEGEYESLEVGTLLRELEVRVDFDGQTLALSRLNATDGGSGRLSAKGRFEIEPDEGYPFEFETKLDNFTLVRRDEVTGSSDGRFMLNGSMNAPAITGRLETRGIEIRIPDRLPPEVIDLEVRELKAEPDTSAPYDEGTRESAPLKVPLDLQVDLPRRIFVRGRGLDSEWAGRLIVKGTHETPIVLGELRLVRGQVSLAGKVFKLKVGTLRFDDEGQIDPAIDLKAVHEKSDVTVTVQVIGPVSNPSIEFSSVPELPRDEIVSHVLFGKSTAKLSALEAVQLAGAVAELSGRGGLTGGVLAGARKMLGIDVLRVESVQNGDESASVLSAGKYLTDAVYVEVDQGMTPETSSAQVELEVTPNISIESSTTQTGQSDIGIRFKWDY